MHKPKISVIIPTLNEEKYIKYPITGLKKQSFHDFETIFVDGHSVDKTVAIASKYARVVTQKKGGVGEARNYGAKFARGDILVFIDGDTKPSRNLLTEYISIFNDTSIVAATGPILPLENTSKRVRAGYKFTSEIFVRLTLLIGKPSIVGSNLAVRKSAFNKIGGFNADLTTYEDWDLSIRLGKLGKICYNKNAIVYSSIRRVAKWGMSKYATFHIGNMFRYTLLKKPKSDYAPIR
ncbi:MAG: glycosyltransferase [Candidatus Marsarchaeota archaeon]|jgi:glycosyltransferase involved in cell wall biosynthesis|nr:glycosyltransferase [Candidatus Marsarchaeota archaeon]